MRRRLSRGRATDLDVPCPAPGLVMCPMPKAIPMPPSSPAPAFEPPNSARSHLGATLTITGTIMAEEDLELGAAITGAVSAPGCCVVVRPGASMRADIVARDLTIHGRVTGRLTATEIVDIRAAAHVDGQIAAPRVALEEGCHVHARIETRKVDAAVHVAQYRRRK
jgi:cytoskeletal protein CcmA (bactofilin family)